MELSSRFSVHNRELGATAYIVQHEQRLREAIELGEERTFEQGPKYAIRLLVDIAIKALSPAINYPTTAVQALNQIEDLLLRLGQRHLEMESIATVKANCDWLFYSPHGAISLAWLLMR
jgi:uncharacterized membrane protein